MDDLLENITHLVSIVDRMTASNSTSVVNPNNSNNNNNDFHLISSDVIYYIHTVLLSVTAGILSISGIATNVINIIVFVRMGFKETINIALFGLSLSDLLSLISLLWSAICYNPLFISSGVNFLTVEIQFRTGGWCHLIFSRVTTFITMFITLERCLCIVFPLKIKNLFTPKRVIIIMISIYVFVIGTLSTNFTNFYFGRKFVPRLNQTMVGMMFRPNRKATESLVYYFNIIYTIVPFTGVFICSLILISKIKERRRWRESVTAVEKDESSKSKSRDSQIINMVTCVAVIFIIGFTPSLAVMVTILIESRLGFGKQFGNLFMVLVAVTYLSNAVNATVNIVVYYRMSSKYCHTLKVIIWKGEQKGSAMNNK